MCPAPHSAQPGRTVGPTQGASRGQSTESETVSCSRFTGTDVAMAKLSCPFNQQNQQGFLPHRPAARLRRSPIKKSHRLSKPNVLVAAKHPCEFSSHLGYR